MKRSLKSGCAFVAVLALGVGVLSRVGPGPSRQHTNHDGEAASARERAQQGDRAREDGGEGDGGEGEGENEALYSKERTEAFYGPRRYPFKAIPSGALAQAQQQAARLPRATGAPSGGPKAAIIPLAWTALGPHPITSSASAFYNGNAPYSGRVSSLAPDPTNSSIAYLAAAAGGVWKTTDAGTNWTPIFDAQATMSIGAIALDGSAPSTVFVGTGEGDLSADAYLGNGLYKSTNAGSTWAKVGGTTFDNCSISDVAIQPGSPSIVFVAARSANTPVGITNPCTGARSGVYRSTDGGATWSQVLSSTTAMDFGLNQTDPTVLWMGTANGQLWKLINAGVVEVPIIVIPGSGLGTGRVEVETAPSDGNSVYAIYATSTGAYSKMVSSANGGSTWAVRSGFADFCNAINGVTTSGQCGYDLTMAVDPQDPTTVFAAGVNAWKFTNSGGSAIRIANTGTTATVHVDMHTMAFTGNGRQSTTRRLWLGTDGGAYRSDDLGVSFTNLNNDLEITQMNRGISGRGTVTAPLISGTQDNGTIRYVGTQGWTEPRVGDGGFTAIDASNNQVLYDTYTYLAINKSTDGGANFADLNAQTTVCLSKNCLFYAPIIGDPVTANTVYAGSKFLWYSVDGGNNWTHGTFVAFPSFVSAIGVSRTSPAQTIYVGLAGGGIWATTDRGDSYFAGGGLPTRFVTDIEVNPANRSEAYATVSGFGTGHVWHTTNGGVLWTNVSGNLPNVPVNAITIDWRANTPLFWLGTDIGVFASNDFGNSWINASSASNPIPRTPVLDLVLDPLNDTLIAATHGRGAFRALIGPPNDQFVSAIPIGPAPGTMGATTTGATAETGEPSPIGGRSIWYDYTAPGNGTLTVNTCGSSFDTTLGVYVGSAVNLLTTSAFDDDSNSCGVNSLQSATSLAVNGGTRYHVRVDGLLGVTGTASLTWNFVPANDAFANATAVAGDSGSGAGLNTGATIEAGEPAASGNHTIWYRYTAARDGRLQFDTCTTGFDTVLWAYTGSFVSGLTQAAFNDDDNRCGANSTASFVDFPVTAGTTYSLRVDSFAAATSGPVALHWQMRPTNDTFANAQELSGASGSTPGNNTLATLETGEPTAIASFPVGASVWYSYTPTATGTLIVDTCGTSFDTLVGVYTGTAVGALTSVAEGDEGCNDGSNATRLTLPVTVGTPYVFDVAGYDPGSGPATGPLTVHWQLVSVASIVPNKRGRNAVNSTVTVNGTGFAPGAVASFSGTGITVNSTTVTSATQLTLSVSVAGNATLGLHDVTVTNADATAATCTGCFTVANAPIITTLAPTTAARGATNKVITVTGNNFRTGARAAFSGSGITVVSTVRVSVTQLTVTINVAPGATAGPRNLTVINSDGGRSTKTNALTIT